MRNLIKKRCRCPKRFKMQLIIELSRDNHAKDLYLFRGRTEDKFANTEDKKHFPKIMHKWRDEYLEDKNIFYLSGRYLNNFDIATEINSIGLDYEVDTITSDVYVWVKKNHTEKLRKHML